MIWLVPRPEHLANADLASALRSREGRETEQAKARDEDAETREYSDQSS